MMTAMASIIRKLALSPWRFSFICYDATTRAGDASASETRCAGRPFESFSNAAMTANDLFLLASMSRSSATNYALTPFIYGIISASS